MPSLFAHLIAFAALDLRAIAIHLGINRIKFTRKAEWAEAIDCFWRTSPTRQALLSALSADAMTALVKLAHYPAIPRSLLLGEFGRLNPGRQPRRKQTAARAAIAPTDELFSIGLLYGADARSPRRTAAFCLPADLCRIIAEFLSVPPAANPAMAHADTGSSPRVLVHDVAQAVVFLHAFAALETVSTDRAHTKLTATRLRRLNAHLWTPESPPPSLLRTHRLRWLLLWAHAAALLDHNNRPTPAARQWLDLPLAEQVRLLWDGWRTAPPALRARYALPDAALPEPWPALFWTAFAAMPYTFTPADLITTLLADRQWDRYWATHFETLAELEATVAETLAQGVVEFALVANTAAGFTMTPFARWLAGSDDALRHTDLQAPNTWHVTEEVCTLTVAAAHCSSGLLQVAPFANHETLHIAQGAADSSGAAPQHRYHFTAETVARAVRCGLPLTLLFDGLQRLAIAVTGTALRQITRWGQPAPVATVNVYTVLRVADRATLSTIVQHPATRRCVAEVLSPTVALMHGTPDEVGHALHQAGFALEGAALVADKRTAAGNLDATEAAGLWLAGQAYALLGKYAPLPMTPPYADLERLLAGLPAPQQAALHALRDQLAEAVTNLLDGQVYAPTYEPTDPEQWRPLLDAAASTGALLDMVYVSPARNLPTLHRVEPYWREEKRGVHYLRAYCHLADAVLLFRLDRIQSLRYTIVTDS